MPAGTTIIIRAAAPAPENRPDFVPAAGILVLDADADGLPDDAERRFGTQWQDPDTDGDGYSDGEEVRNGFNPLGPGRLVEPLTGVDRAIADGKPLEEPRAEESKIDADFTVASAASPIDDFGGGSTLRLGGTAVPNAVVTIYIYSFLPVVVTTTTDADGTWSYDFSSRLVDGRHEAYVSVNDDQGKIVKTSSPFSFFVREARAASEADFLRGDVNIVRPEAVETRWFLIGGLALIIVALVLVIVIVRQARKPFEPPTTTVA